MPRRRPITTVIRVVRAGDARRRLASCISVRMGVVLRPGSGGSGPVGDRPARAAMMECAHRPHRPRPRRHGRAHRVVGGRVRSVRRCRRRGVLPSRGCRAAVLARGRHLGGLRSGGPPGAEAAGPIRRCAHHPRIGGPRRGRDGRTAEHQHRLRAIRVGRHRAERGRVALSVHAGRPGAARSAARLALSEDRRRVGRRRHLRGHADHGRARGGDARADVHGAQPPQGAHHLPAHGRAVLRRRARGRPGDGRVLGVPGRRAPDDDGRDAPARRALRKRGRPVWWAALWAWCPLVASEVVTNSHVDALGALLALARRSSSPGGCGGAAASRSARPSRPSSSR
ncbi:hypothetical protein BC477_02825 [Clavibacter michiganensis subsp. michiganensis]|uniref:Uncharacterized protein n=1 Tax=Clavibacter michiganensis subsp. michiganensis TaxID=33013 RepID=A0A251XJF3_CLAMM|nr:hypothetical protein BC477_02825 [Clavibacter michiganensis subsp. michiganensis]OUE03645.1 hypothetical protein CMMCAS07_01760 [Clavibacter michiganensis subsp. michiganensis]